MNESTNESMNQPMNQSMNQSMEFTWSRQIWVEYFQILFAALGLGFLVQWKEVIESSQTSKNHGDNVKETEAEEWELTHIFCEDDQI